jgi:hypothetical protein
VLRFHPALRLLFRTIVLAIAVVVAQTVPWIDPSVSGAASISAAHDRIAPETVKVNEQSEPRIAPASVLERVPLLPALAFAAPSLRHLHRDTWYEAPSRIGVRIGHPQAMRRIHRMESDDPPRG